MDIICGLGFVNEELNYVKLGVDGIELPIGTTGAFLQSINGYVNNIADKDATNIQFGGGLGFTAGRKSRLVCRTGRAVTWKGHWRSLAVDGGFYISAIDRFGYGQDCGRPGRGSGKCDAELGERDADIGLYCNSI